MLGTPNLGEETGISGKPKMTSKQATELWNGNAGAMWSRIDTSGDEPHAGAVVRDAWNNVLGMRIWQCRGERWDEVGSTTKQH